MSAFGIAAQTSPATAARPFPTGGGAARTSSPAPETASRRTVSGRAATRTATSAARSRHASPAAAFAASGAFAKASPS